MGLMELHIWYIRNKNFIYKPKSVRLGILLTIIKKNIKEMESIIHTITLFNI